MFEESEMSRHIFAATEKLIASVGLSNLSMQKIAKEAGISAGTIYIYFKSKDELLMSLANDLFQRFSNVLSESLDPTLSFFEQYRNMWLALWRYLRANPDFVRNIHQYEALSNFYNAARDYRESEHNIWRNFIKKAQKAGVVNNLSDDILFILSIDTVLRTASCEINSNVHYDDHIVEQIIQCSWDSILIKE